VWVGELCILDVLVDEMLIPQFKAAVNNHLEIPLKVIKGWDIGGSSL
jgi:hypothetical protein